MIKNNTTELQNILNTINNLPEAGSGGALPALTNEGTAADLLSGKQLIDSDGEVVTGTIPTKTSSNLTASGATVTVPAGYYASQATKSVATATQATPSITVSSGGLITAKSTQSAGYVASGTKQATKQLTVQAAQTITPGTSNKTIASGRYLTGTQTIKGDANLVAGNIKSGVSIFGVMGSYEGSGGGTSIETCTVTIDSTVYPHSVSGYFIATVFENGVIGYLCDALYQYDLPKTFDNIIKDSALAIVGPNGFQDYVVSDNLIHLTFGSAGAMSYWVAGDGTITANPCFAKNTKIILADGTIKLIQDITYQDDLLVWDFDNGCYTSAKPLWIKKAQTTDYYYLCKFANGAELKLIGSNGKCHRLLDIEKGSFESATDCVGKRVMSNEGETTLVSCERVDEEVEFYNIITHTHINLFAEGMLTSCRLNNIYPIQNMKFIKDNRVKKLREDYPKIGSDMFRGLRIAEQHMSKEEIDTYVNRLYALMDWKPRYFVDDHTGTGNIIELTEAEYLAVTGTDETRPYASQVYRGIITIDEVPEELREEVQTVVNNKIARWGTYESRDIPDSEALNIITGGNQE